MAIISGNTILTSISLFHITLGYFFLTSPVTVADQNLVFIIGEAMKLPESRSFDAPSPALSFLGAVFAIIGISDLISISMPEEISSYHWGSQAPIRLTLFFLLTFYTYAFSSSSPIYDGKGYMASGWGEGLKNRVVFAWAFVEMVTWFWIFVTLREERRELVQRMFAKRAAEEDEEEKFRR